jgi:pimeloyl-ACP methyl ester carboxylesterase
LGGWRADYGIGFRLIWNLVTTDRVGCARPVHSGEPRRRGSRGVPGSRLEIFDGVGHYPHCEAPARFVEVPADFIASTKPARLSARSPRRRGAAQHTAG